jgi:hypothetical protein
MEQQSAAEPALFLDDALQYAHRAHSVGPTGVERQMQQGLLQLVRGDSVLQCEAQVEFQLLGLAQCGQRGDSDEAAVTLGQVLAFPHLVEQDLVGVVDHSRREVAECVLSAGPAGPRVLSHFSSSFSRRCTVFSSRSPRAASI